METIQLLIQAHSILSKPLISPEDIIEVKKILNEEIQLQMYYKSCEQIESKQI